MPRSQQGEDRLHARAARVETNDVVAPYADKFPGAQFFPGRKPWEVKVDIAMPCATQNELDGEDARKLVGNGCRCVAEGANMPSTPEAIRLFQQHRLLYAPGKAATPEASPPRDSRCAELDAS